MIGLRSSLCGGTKGFACFQVAPFEDRRPEDRRPLFISGSFQLHSGDRSNWKIDCGALSDAELEVLAAVAAERLPPFGLVRGIPTGGNRLAGHMRRHADRSSRAVLLVDDVLTTGASMRRARGRLQAGGWEVVGLVLFARTEAEPWVHRLWQLAGEYSR